MEQIKQSSAALNDGDKSSSDNDLLRTST